MKHCTLFILLALLSLDAEQVNSADAPEGKVHIYKQESDTAREMEIFFPKDHDPATKAVPGIIIADTIEGRNLAPHKGGRHPVRTPEMKLCFWTSYIMFK